MSVYPQRKSVTGIIEGQLGFHAIYLCDHGSLGTISRLLTVFLIQGSHLSSLCFIYGDIMMILFCNRSEAGDAWERI